jgi:hypothetical protein
MGFALAGGAEELLESIDRGSEIWTADKPIRGSARFQPTGRGEIAAF